MATRHLTHKLLFWTYLFQIAIVSLFLFIWAVLVVTDSIPNKMGTAFSRYPWFETALPLGSALLTLVSGVAIILYRKGNVTWAHWTIGAGVVYALFFIWRAYAIHTLYSTCMVFVNLVCIVELYKYILWRRRSEGEYHVVDKNDKSYVRYTGSYDDCLKLFEIEYDDFKQSHKIISDRKLTRIIKRMHRYRR